MKKPEPPPASATKLVLVMAERDKLARELRAERIKSGNLRFRLAQAMKTTDSAKLPDPPTEPR